MVKTCESWIPPSPNFDKVTVEKLNITDLFRISLKISDYYWPVAHYATRKANGPGQ